ncbi:MAG: hypothetical protein ACRDTV_11630 [Mycobacterium sp.]
MFPAPVPPETRNASRALMMSVTSAAAAGDGGVGGLRPIGQSVFCHG